MTMTRGQAAKNIVDMINGTVFKLVRARDLLSQAERFEVAEVLRDCADALDQGKVMKAPHPAPAQPLQWWLRRHLVRIDKCDHDGRPLYKIVP